MLSLQYLTLQSLATGLVPASQSSPVIIRITVLTSSISGRKARGKTYVICRSRTFYEAEFELQLVLRWEASLQPPRLISIKD